MFTNYNFPILEQIISSELFGQLRSLWMSTANKVGKNHLFVTEQELLALSNENVEINSYHTREKFSLLITPQFNALLLGVTESRSDYCQTSISFEPTTIISYLNRLGELYQGQERVVELISSQVFNQVPCHFDYLGEFVATIIQLMLNNNQADKLSDVSAEKMSNSCLNCQPVEPSLYYQLEQQKILENLKNYVSQNADFSETVQMVLERVQKLLHLDRLVIYQLNVVSDLKMATTQPINLVTHEAKSQENIASLLNFKEDNCFTNPQQSWHKYRQGFSLAINDVESGCNLDPCLANLMQQLGVKAKLVTPINLRSRLWGFLIAHQCDSIRSWRDSEIHFLRQIANCLAIAVHQDQSLQQLQKQKQLLEKQVQTQAQQIENALVAAQAASQSKHDFLGNMSHELRTPLTRIIGLSGTLLHWSLAQGNIPLPIEKQQQYLKTIHDSGKHLLSLINTILELSEVESGKRLLNIDQISLSRLARKVLHSLQEEAHNKSIELILDFQIAPGEDCFDADNIKLQEILFNLVNNGIKFTPETGQVILRIWREDKTVIFEVEDTGIGISENQMPLLFEKFQQLENSRQRIHGGTGLGLTLTKHLVELHGGTIEVESSLGNGSLFRISLPDQVRISPLQNHSLITIDNTSYKSKTVVLITQDEVVAAFICELLTAGDYKVVWLIDATTAIQQIILLEAKIVIFDQELQADMKNFINTLKGVYNSEIPRLVLLCDQMPDSQWTSLAQTGIQDYLIKSMNLAQILTKLDTLMV